MNKDISDLHREIGPEGLAKAVMEKAKPISRVVSPKPVKQWPALVGATEFLADETIKAPAELIKDLLHKGATAVLGGGSKTNKTWTLLDIATSVATGKPWWDLETVQGEVIYINLELMAHTLQQRIVEIQKVKEGTEDLSKLHIWQLRGFPLEIGELVDQALITFEDKDLSLIIVDPIYRTYGDKDENSATQMTAVFKQVERLAESTNAAVIFGAHYSKGNQAGKEAMDRLSGSGAFARFPDLIITLTKNAKEDVYDVETISRNMKGKDTFCVRWQFPVMVTTDQATPGQLKLSGQKKKVHFAETLLEVLGTEKLTNKEWQAEVVKKGMSERTFANLKAELVAARRVVKTGDLWAKV
jgi:hypothetical protein